MFGMRIADGQLIHLGIPDGEDLKRTESLRIAQKWLTIEKTWIAFLLSCWWRWMQAADLAANSEQRPKSQIESRN